MIVELEMMSTVRSGGTWRVMSGVFWLLRGHTALDCAAEDAAETEFHLALSCLGVAGIVRVVGFTLIALDLLNRRRAWNGIVTGAA